MLYNALKKNYTQYSKYLICILLSFGVNRTLLLIKSRDTNIRFNTDGSEPLEPKRTQII